MNPPDDNTSTVNVYYHAGSSTYRIQNRRGGSRSFRVVMLGKYN